MIETKPGNGGHGLEAYDTETGKYASVSFGFSDPTNPANNTTIEKWEDMKDAMLKWHPEFKNAIDSGQISMEDFENVIKDEFWKPSLQQFAEQSNYDGASRIQFSSPEDAAKNVHKLFGKKLVSTYLSNLGNAIDMFYGLGIQVNPYKEEYKVSLEAACMQMCRYKGNNRMQGISLAEYRQLEKRSIASNIFNRYSLSYLQELHRYVKNSPVILVNRNMGISNENVWKEVKRSFWDPNSKINSILSDVSEKNCSYFGSVCYMSAGTNVKYSSSSYNHHCILGAVENSPDLKILYNYRVSGDDNQFHELDTFRKTINDPNNHTLENLTNCFIEHGGIPQSNAEKIAKNFLRRMNADCGLCAMIMGYDALCGESYQFDILNPSIVKVVTDD